MAMWHESFPVLSHGEEHEGAAHFAGTGTACVVLLYHVVRQAEHAMQRVSRQGKVPSNELGPPRVSRRFP